MNENTPNVFDNARFQEYCFDGVDTEGFRGTSVALTAPYDQHLYQPPNDYFGVAVPRPFFSPPAPPNMVAIPDHSNVPNSTPPAMRQCHLRSSITLNTTTHMLQPEVYTNRYSNLALRMPSRMSQIEPPQLQSATQCPSYPIPPSPGQSSAQGYRSATSSGSQDDGRNVAQECLDAGKQIPLDAVTVTGSQTFVPQKLYKPRTERYIEGVTLLPPIIFLTEGPSEWGIPLVDVLNGELKRLLGKDDLVLEGCGPSVSIRINWPGYSSFKRYIPSRNFRKTKGPITKGRLAKNLAITTRQFIQKMSSKAMEDDADAKWKIGSSHIKVEDLILVSLHHVSKGSWQPQFRMRQTTPNQISHRQLLRHG